MNIAELRDRVRELPVLADKMAVLQKELAAAEGEAAKLLSDYEKEHGDVERLKNGSLSSLLLMVVGKYEDALGGEQQEEVNAKLAYDRVTVIVSDLLGERALLGERIAALRAEEREYQTRLNARRSKLRGEPAKELAKLRRERSAVIKRRTKLREAIRAASEAKPTVSEARVALENAQGWAIFTTLMGRRHGVVSTIVQDGYLDEVEHLLNKLSSQLRGLKREIVDATGMSVQGLTKLSSTPPKPPAEEDGCYWFDNIIDYRRMRVVGDMGGLEALLRGIEAAETALRQKLAECEAALETNRGEEEALLAAL